MTKLGRGTPSEDLPLCGIIRRRDGGSDEKPCKGPARIELRGTEGRTRSRSTDEGTP